MFRSIRVKNLFLRLLPYLMSIVAGIIVYIAAIYTVKDVNFSGLLLNIAAGLLSIPMIFISYELIGDIVSKDIKDSVLQNLLFEINYVIIDLIKTSKEMLGLEEPLDKESLERLLGKSKRSIALSLKIKDTSLETLQEIKDKLFKLTHNNTNIGVLSDAQIQSLMMIAKRVIILSGDIAHMQGKERTRTIDDNFYDMLQEISRWVDLGEEDAIINHHNFELA